MVLSPLPGFIAWPVLGYASALTAGRLLLFRDTIADQFLNRILLWCLLALALYRCTWTTAVAELAQLPALGCLVVMAMYILGLARFWDADGDVAAIWRRQRGYCLVAAASAVAILGAGLHAHARGRSIDMGSDLDGMVLAVAFGGPMAVSAVTMLWVGGRWLRRTESAKEKVFYYALIIDTAYILANQGLSTMQMLTGWPDLGPHLPRVEFITVVCLVSSSTLLAVPLGTWLLERLGLDRPARSCRRLRPLWRDLTAAVPEIVLVPDTGAREQVPPATRLLRMAVEVRDALLHLRPYFPEGDESPLGTADYAHRLAYAVQARKTGGPPVRAEVVPRSPLGARDFDTDLRHLLALARIWPRASTALGQNRQPPVGSRNGVPAATV
ncbi:MAB_1171c family putative transporter [Nocardia beijingensis]|uniref:MAB_1171c family putative transporter n=1 Tax=Nocardia beijingensis TaxID=95162 RepID=UPI0033DF1E85